MKRLKEFGTNNYFLLEHDDVGPYIEFNEVRMYLTSFANLGSGGGLSAPVTPTGSINGINASFVFPAPPKMIFRNGVMEYRLGSVAGNTFTFDTPPETGDDIEGYV